MIVVSNTTPIITLASIGQTELLQKLFGKVYIAQAVHQELKAKRYYGYDEVDSEIFEVYEIKDTLAQNILLNDLDLGEAQTIILAKELDADTVLIDENVGYDIALSQNLTVKRLNQRLGTAEWMQSTVKWMFEVLKLNREVF